MAAIWSLLSAATPIIATILSLALVFLGKVIWNHEKRIRGLEKDGTRVSRTLYGDENDNRATGLAHDLDNIERRIENVEQTLSYIERHLSDINGYDRSSEEDRSDD